MITFLALRVTKNRSYFPKKTGISSIFSPYTILKCKQINFNKEFLHSFGDYVQATDDKSPKNNNLPRSIDAIYICTAESLQGGHEMIDLATGRMFTRPQVKAFTMTQMVIERVELLAEKQVYKTLNYLIGSGRGRFSKMLTCSQEWLEENILCHWCSWWSSGSIVWWRVINN